MVKLCPLWLISIALCSIIGSALSKPAFALKMHTTDKQELLFHIMASEANILINEKLINCRQEIDCQILSSVRLYEYFNKTSYSYLPIQISLFTHDNQKLTFVGRLTDLDAEPIFGMKSVAKWNSLLPTGSLKVDTVTGETIFLANEPANLQRLEINPDTREFYIPATLHIETTEWGQLSTTRSDAVLQLQFPSPENLFNGEYLFMLTNDHMVGWDQAMTVVSVKTQGNSFQMRLRFGENNLVNLGPSIFRAYDGEAFKRRLTYTDKKETHIGRYFAHKTALKLYLTVAANDPQLSVFAEITDNKVEYYYWVSFVGFMKFASWIAFFFAVVLIALNLVPLKYKQWLPESFSARVPITNG